MSLYSIGTVGDRCTGDGPFLPSLCISTPQFLLYVINGMGNLSPAQVIGAKYMQQYLDPAMTLPTPAGVHYLRETIVGSSLVFVNGVPLCKMGDDITNVHYPPNLINGACVGSMVAQGSTLAFLGS